MCSVDRVEQKLYNSICNKRGKGQSCFFKAFYTYHNVGQGLFFSGKLKVNRNMKFNFVYDCGSESLSVEQLKNRIDNFVHVLLDKNERNLDLLVISHFHNDHINGLDYLLDKVTVDTVVIPYLSPIEILLYAVVNSKPPFPPDSYYEFLANPFEYLVEKGVNKVIVIGREEENGYKGDDFVLPDVLIKPNEKLPFNYEEQGDDKGNKQIKNRLINEYKVKNLIDKEKIIPKSHYGFSVALGIYLFRFFNARKSIPDFRQKIEDFKSCLSEKFRDVVEWNNSILAEKEILKELRRKRNNKFKECYEKAFGRYSLNLTSLILFNLPIINRIDKCCCKAGIRLHPFFFNCPLYKRIWWLRKYIHSNNCGQFLTGDAELKNKQVFDEFKEHYKRVLDRSFIFQLPHHGSWRNWNKDILVKLPKNEIFIASAGINSKYNHPSWSVIWEIISNGNFTIFVNELNWFEFHVKCYIERP